MKFTIIPADTFIWNHTELLDFLMANQGLDIEISTNAEGCCARTVGLYSLLDKFHFRSVKITTANPLEKHSKYTIQINHGEYLYVDRSVDSKYHSWNQSYYFGTIYARPLWHRIGIATHLKTKHKDKSTVGFISDAADIDHRPLFEIQQLWNYDPATAADFLTHADTLPWKHNTIGQYCPGRPNSRDYVDDSLDLYQDFLIDVVAESFTSGDCFFVTEKTVRPMIMKKPFIAMAPCNFLDYLHQMGFKTFNDFWSEEYDGFTGADRYVKILTLIDELANKSLSELLVIYQKMQNVLAHNYDLLLSGNYNKNIKFIE